MGNHCKQQSHNCIKKTHHESFQSKLYPCSLVKENQFVWILPVHQKHGHFPYYNMHCPRDAEEINEDGTGKPNSWIVKHGFAGEDLSSSERGPNQQKPNDQNHLLLRNDG